MTRNEYLLNLATKLQAMEGDQNALFPEIKRVVAFYQEMLDDMIEDGKSEEDAVAAMESVESIVARVKAEFLMPEAPDVEITLPPPSAKAEPKAEPKAEEEGGERVSGRQMGKYTRMTRVYNFSAFTGIIVQDQNTAIRVKKGKELSIEYCDGPDGHYEVNLDGGIIDARFISSMRWLTGLFGNRAGIEKDFVITLPEDWKGGLNLHTSNGGIDISDVGVESVEARSSNGAINAQHVAGDMIKLTTSNSRITAENVASDNIKLVSSNGGLKLSQIAATIVEASTSNARITSDNVAASDVSLVTTNGGNDAHQIACGKLRMESRNGAVSFDRIKAEDITLATSNGAVKGSIVGAMGDFAITSRTSNGSSNLPPASEGVYKLDVHTSNGRIDVEFVK